MKDFHALDTWGKDQNFDRWESGRLALVKNDIEYTSPSKGHLKIKSDRCHSLMFYPKTGTIIWKEHRKGFQHRYQNDDEGKLMQKLKDLI